MIVCLCHGVSDRKLTKMLHNGQAKTVRELQAKTGCGMECGSCVDQLHHLVEMIESRRVQRGQVASELLNLA